MKLRFFLPILGWTLWSTLTSAQLSLVVEQDSQAFITVAAINASRVQMTTSQGSILRSEDDGMSFDTTTFSPCNFMNGLEFLNPFVGFACHFAFPEDSLCNDIGLYKTTDGGRNWSTAYQENMGESFRIIEPITEDILVAAMGAVVVKSINGGATWDTILTPAIGGFDVPLHIQFLNSQEGWVHAGDYLNVSNPMTYILKTENGGDSWTLLHTGVFQFSDFFQMLPNGKGFSGGMNFGYYTTDDFGDTWQSRFIFNTVETPIQLQMVNESVGFMATVDEFDEGHLYRTLNGGVTWEKQWTWEDGAWVTSMDFSSPSKGYLVTDQNKLWKWDLPVPTQETQVKLGLKLSPNPTFNTLTIQGDLPSSGYINVLRMDGQKVYEASLNATNPTVDVEDLVKGMYILQITNAQNQRVFSDKFVKM